MKLFHSPLTMTLLIAAAVLLWIGARGKKGHVLPIFGALAAVCAALTAVLQSGSWQEGAICLLFALLADALGRGRNG